MTVLQSTVPQQGQGVNVNGGDIPPWIRTPCVFSESLSKAAGCQVFAKLDLLQPSGSFKSRGVGNFVWQTTRERGSASRPLHFFSSSKGNAGIAAAMAARKSGQKATVVVPEMTDQKLISRIESAGARVIIHGDSLGHAEEYARLAVAASSDRVFVSPYDHEKIWQGNSTLIDEIADEWEGEPPDAIICSVGGGGLLNGIMLGLDRHGWSQNVTVLGVETEGADCLSKAIQANQQVTMAEMPSIAKSLCVPRVSSRTLDLIQRRSNIQNVVLSDADAARACVRFANDEKMMVEPACGVSLAPCYNGILHNFIRGFGPESRVVVIVCGGSNIDMATLLSYDSMYKSCGMDRSSIMVNGVERSWLKVY